MNLIINADDFGLRQGVNRAVISLLEDGHISSASVMVKRDSGAYREAVSFIRGFIQNTGRASFGLHLDLDEIFPFDETGCYGSDEYDIIDGYDGIIKNRKKEITNEIKTQASILRNDIGIFSHLDSHHNVHLFPGILEIAAAAMNETGITRMRFRRAFYCSDESLHAAERLISRGGISVPGSFHDLGGIISGNESIDLSRKGSAEIMAHPEYFPDSGTGNEHYQYLRQGGLSGYNIISFRDI